MYDSDPIGLGLWLLVFENQYETRACTFEQIGQSGRKDALDTLDIGQVQASDAKELFLQNLGTAAKHGRKYWQHRQLRVPPACGTRVGQWDS